MSWAESPSEELIKQAWPVVVSLLSYAFMTVATTMFVGHLGADALAAVGIGTTASFTLLCFGFGLLRGVKTLAAQAEGAGKKDQNGALLGSSLVVAIGLGLLVLVLGQFGHRVIPRFTATENAGRLASEFLRIRLLSAPLLLSFVALREYRYGIADSRGPMVASVTSNVVAIGSNWFLIKALGLGVAGAAWATVIAEVMGLAILGGIQLRSGCANAKPRLSILRALVSVGAPTGIQFALEVGSFSVLAAIIASMSSAEMAAHQITLQLIHFAFLPAVGLGESASVLVGQAVGANRDDLVRPVARLAAKLAAGYAMVCTLIMAFGGAFLMGLFTTDVAVAHEARNIGWVACAFMVADAFNVVARGALRGTGDVKKPAMIGIVTSWLATPPLAWFLGHMLGYGAVGAWIGLAVEIIVGAVILFLRVERGGWKDWARESRRRLAEVPATPPTALLDEPASA